MKASVDERYPIISNRPNVTKKIGFTLVKKTSMDLSSAHLNYTILNSWHDSLTQRLAATDKYFLISKVIGHSVFREFVIEINCVTEKIIIKFNKDCHYVKTQQLFRQIIRQFAKEMDLSIKTIINPLYCGHQDIHMVILGRGTQTEKLISEITELRLALTDAFIENEFCYQQGSYFYAFGHFEEGFEIGTRYEDGNNCLQIRFFSKFWEGKPHLFQKVVSVSFEFAETHHLMTTIKADRSIQLIPNSQK